MKAIVTGEDMKMLDLTTIQDHFIPAMVLMERAAVQIYQEIKKEEQHLKEVLIVCGGNNNGGDGLALARLMHQDGIRVTVVMTGSENHMTQETKQQLIILNSYKIPVQKAIPNRNYTLLVDCVLGTGIYRDIISPLKEIVEQMNQCNCYKVAVDIPTGINASSGRVMGIAVECDLTICLAYTKVGVLLFPGATYAGKVICVPIGIKMENEFKNRNQLHHLEKEDLDLVPKRKLDGNKSTFGKALIIAGSREISGAALLSCKSCLKSGAGMVKVISHPNNRVTVCSQCPEALFESFPEQSNMDEFLQKQIAWADAVVIGPGIGISKFAKSVVLSVLKQATIPIVLDADGLNNIADMPETLAASKALIIVTPHLGEMSRLIKMPIELVKSDLLSLAQGFSKEYNVICVLKDARTVISMPDGETYINITGNNGMATAGSGDVLTGIIAAFLMQNTTPFMAVPLAVMCHGMAGDLAAEKLGLRSMTAMDLTSQLSEILKRYQ